VRSSKFPIAIIPNNTKNDITLMPFLLKYPRYIGLEVDAKVPTADTIPVPIPLALPG